MTKKEYQKLYYRIFGNTHLRKEFWIKYREVLMSYQLEYIKYFIEIKGKEFMKQHEAKVYEAKKLDAYWKNVAQVTSSTFGNCEAATPVCSPTFAWGPDWSREYKKQGNNPMRIDTTTATAYVTAPKSDDATAREHLLGRLSRYESWSSPKLRELVEFFKLSEDGRPKTYQQLIDAIKNDKFSLDPKAVERMKRIQEDDDLDEDADLSDYGYGPFYGLIFTDLPKADRKGYDAAVKVFEDLLKATKDTIMVKSPDEGLTALQALEAWVPTGKAN